MQVDNKVAAIIIIIVVGVLFTIMNGKSNSAEAATESGNASSPGGSVIVSPF